MSYRICQKYTWIVNLPCVTNELPPKGTNEWFYLLFLSYHYIHLQIIITDILVWQVSDNKYI